MTQILLHNTLTGRREPFVPIEPGQVGLYVCGVTPYDHPHLGHARCYVVFDLLRRVLERAGFAVRHIQNFTDVDDKIIGRARAAGVPPLAYPAPYIDSYFRSMDALHVRRADAYPRVTEHMGEIISLIKTLETKGLAYVADGDVLFSVRSFPFYGALSKRDVADLRIGARGEVGAAKRDPLDFALWKRAKPGEPSWPSPWGDGRPGWHIECSAMAMMALGERFDIHGGGQDLIFPHHENEIAQANGATGLSAGFARFWVHNGFVTINQEKMSKSLGNFFALPDVLARFDPMSVRYFLLSQHYRGPLAFSDGDLGAADTAWKARITSAYDRIRARVVDPAGEASAPAPEAAMHEINDFVSAFTAALHNDLNTPEALGALNRFCTWVFQAEGKAFPAGVWAAARARFSEMCDTLGLKLPEPDVWDAEVCALVDQREAARKARDFAAADRMRDALSARGVSVEDTAAGPRLKRR